MWIATAAEMREIEALALSEHGVSAETLMENAGRRVFEALAGTASAPATVAVVCGPGNNGGDGLVVARLAKEAGFDVRTFLTTTELHGLPQIQSERCLSAGLTFRDLGDPEQARQLKTGEWTVVVDAVLGTGADREPSGTLAEAIDAINKTVGQRISVDVPSGIRCDTGEALGRAVTAHRTVVLGLPKPFLFLRQGPACSGAWEVAEIGFPTALLDRPTSARLAPRTTGLPCRVKDSHKGQNGQVLVVAGSRQYRGAATLAALGALRSGGGLVTVAAIEPVIAAVAAQVPEATFVLLPEESGSVSEKGAAVLIEGQESWDAAVIGPGLGMAPTVGGFLASLWRDWRVPSVIDADALSWMAQGVASPSAFCVLTPHPGEAGRLLGRVDPAAEVQHDRFGAARELSAKWKRPVLLKGAYSLYAIDGEPLIVNPTGNPGMASGGSGDVLAGVVATLLAQLPAGHRSDAGWKGALWHGLAGDLCAQEIGEIGFSASDLAQFLPQARSILTK